jgi:uncharacterized protein YndB with AHSA1/START domain
MLVKILIVINLLLVGVLVVAATKPDTLRVERSIVINAPPAKIFALLDDFHQWPQWAPQDRDDSSMTRNYSGAASGVGAVSEWRGKVATGHGRMEITESIPDSRVVARTDFLKPFVAHNENQFTLQPEGATTRVTWTMQGRNRYLMKVMSVFVNMDNQAGKHFETGLKSLKVAAEK